MATKARRRARVGDEAWHVEWCSDIPVTEFGDRDLDRATEHCVIKWSSEEAWKYAKEVYPKDQFGAVRVTPVRFVAYDDDDAAEHPHVGFWDAIGDSEYYEGED